MAARAHFLRASLVALAAAGLSGCLGTREWTAPPSRVDLGPPMALEASVDGQVEVLSDRPLER